MRRCSPRPGSILLSSRHELKGVGVAAAELGGGDVSLDGLGGEDLLLLLDLGLLGLRLGAAGGGLGGSDGEVGLADGLVEALRQADVGVADEGVHVRQLHLDLVGLVVAVVLQPLLAHLDGLLGLGGLDAEPHDRLAVADVGDEQALRVFGLIAVEALLGLLVLALVEPAERAHVEDLLPDRGALVLRGEGVEGLAGLVPLILREQAGGDPEVQFHGRVGRQVGDVGTGPLVVFDGLLVVLVVL